jgi:hypothetical protein
MSASGFAAMGGTATIGTGGATFTYTGISANKLTGVPASGTGHDFKDYLGHSAIAEGAWSYLVKPCLPERLAREIGVRLVVSGSGHRVGREDGAHLRCMMAMGT